MTNTYREIRRAFRAHLVDARPEWFRWMPRLMRSLHNSPVPQPVKSHAHILEKWFMPANLYECASVSPGNLSFRVRMGDAIQAQIYYCGGFEQYLKQWFLAHVRPNSIVADVGAHCGQWALLASIAQPNVEVHAFEPEPTSVADLQRNIEINDLRNIVVHPTAVADRCGTTTLFSDLDNFGFANTSLARGANTFGGPKNETAIDTLDNVLSAITRPVSLIKLDIEGAELLALRGAERILRRDRPALLFEVDSRWMEPFGYAPEDLLRFLADMGYRCALLNQKGDEVDISSRALQGSSDNWVAVPTNDRPT